MVTAGARTTSAPPLQARAVAQGEVESWMRGVPRPFGKPLPRGQALDRRDELLGRVGDRGAPGAGACRRRGIGRPGPDRCHDDRLGVGIVEQRLQLAQPEEPVEDRPPQRVLLGAAERLTGLGHPPLDVVGAPGIEVLLGRAPDLVGSQAGAGALIGAQPGLDVLQGRPHLVAQGDHGTASSRGAGATGADCERPQHRGDRRTGGAGRPKERRAVGPRPAGAAHHVGRRPIVGRAPMTRRSMVSAISSTEYGPRPDSSARIATSRERSVGSQTLRCWRAASSASHHDHHEAAALDEAQDRGALAHRGCLQPPAVDDQVHLPQGEPRQVLGQPLEGETHLFGGGRSNQDTQTPRQFLGVPTHLFARAGGPGALQLRGQADHARDHLQAEASGHVTAAGVTLDTTGVPRPSGQTAARVSAAVVTPTDPLAATRGTMSTAVSFPGGTSARLTLPAAARW